MPRISAANRDQATQPDPGSINPQRLRTLQSTFTLKKP
jgi:hypothetical protein